MELHETIMGRQFYERDIPAIRKALTKIAAALESKAASRAVPAGYNLIYKEISDTFNTVVAVKSFAALEAARRAMQNEYAASDRILQFTAMETDDKHYIKRNADSICIRNEDDSYTWEITPIVWLDRQVASDA